MQKLKIQLALIIITFITSLSGFAQDFTIDQAVTVVISQKGFDGIKDQIIPLLTNNGVNLSHFSSDDMVFKTPAKATEEFSDSPAMKKTIKSMKTLMSKYIMGLTLQNHEFQIGIKNILLNAKWNKIEFNVHPFNDNALREDDRSNELFTADLIMVASNIKIKVDSLRIKDLQNAWLGEWGLDKVVLDAKAGTMPLSLKVPLRFYRKDNDMLGIEVKAVETNLKKIKLSLEYSKPIIMPKIQIKIDDNSFSLNQTALEEDLAKQQTAILKSIQEAIDTHAKETIPALLNSYADKFTEGGITEINQMSPPGAPEGQTVPPMIWGIKLNKVAANAGLFALQFKGMVNDPESDKIKLQKITKKTIISTVPMSKSNLTRNNSAYNKYDLTFAFKADFFNKFIETGFKRGYISQIKLDDGDSITLTESPAMYVNDKGVLRMRLVFASRVKGLSTIIVKNPVMVAMEVILGTEIDAKTNKVSLFIKDVDLNSIDVSRSNFRWPFQETGVNKTKAKIAKAREGMKGYSLSDELPVPSELIGLKLTNKAASFDTNGYLLFHSDYE